MSHAGRSIAEFAQQEALAGVLYDLAEQRRCGQLVDLDAVARAYPQYAAELQKLLPTLEALEALDATSAVNDVAGPTCERQVIQQAIGDYQIVREIGRGGMGLVYEARQLSLNRRVALKVLPFAAALDRRALERFQNESQAAARLDHPHIVHVYGMGCERGVHYYAMQFIDGQSLAEVIAAMRAEAERGNRVEKSKESKSGDDEESRGRELQGSPNVPETAIRKLQNENCKSKRADSSLDFCARPFHPPYEEGNNVGASPDPKSGSTLALRVVGLSTARTGNRKEFFRTVVRLGIQVAEALDYAHAQGVLHRDVKPGNILIDDAGDAWIADFGLARIGNEGNLTRTGDVVGTLRYASPEQILAERGLVDQRTDIYSLGATLYELLTLTPVFRNDDRKQLLAQIAGIEPQPPRKIDTTIPSELELIVLKCLEKEPADRYATAHDVAADLKRFLAFEPLLVKPPGPLERLIKWSHRHQTAVLTALVGLSISTAILAASTAWVVHERDLAREAERQEGVQVQVARKATDDAEKSRAEEERQRRLAEAARTKSVEAAEQALNEKQTAQQTAEFVINLFRSGDELGIEGTGFRTRSESARDVTLASLLSRAAERVRLELRDQPRTQAALLDTLGDIYRSLGMFSQAEPLLSDGLQLRQQHLPEDDNRIGESLHHLGWLRHDAGDYQGADVMYRAALEHFERFPPRDLRLKLRLQMNFASLLTDYRKEREAEPIFRGIIAACQSKPEEFAVEMTAAQAGLVASLYGMGREDEGNLTTLKQLAEKNKLLFAATIAQVQDVENLRRAGRYDEALKIQHQLVETVRAHLGAQHPSYALLLGGAAVLYQKRGDWRKAEALMRESMVYGRRSLGDHPKVWEAVRQFAIDLGNRGDFEEAIELLKECRRVVARRYPPPDPYYRGQICELLLRMGHNRMAAGDFAAAETAFAEAIRLCLEETHPDAANVANPAVYQLGLAGMLHDTGRLIEARRQVHDALEALSRSTSIVSRELTVELCVRLAAIERDAGEYDAARAAAANALAVARDLEVEFTRTSGRFGGASIEVLEALREHSWAESRMRNLVTWSQPESGSDPMTRADRTALLGRLLVGHGKYGEAEPICREALAIHRECVAEDDPHCTKGMLQLARALVENGQREEGLRFARDAVSLREKRFGRDHIWYPVALGELAGALDHAGETAEAKEVMTTALELRMRKLPLVHQLISQDHMELAKLHQRLGEHQAAAELLRGHLERLGKVLPDRNWRIAGLESLLAESLIELKDYSTAENLLRQALPIQEADRDQAPEAVEATRQRLARLCERRQN
jgi:serine/threonine protein kinase/tetratricopeptide (TPR) repeat protein